MGGLALLSAQLTAFFFLVLFVLYPCVLCPRRSPPTLCPWESPECSRSSSEPLLWPCLRWTTPARREGCWVTLGGHVLLWLLLLCPQAALTSSFTYQLSGPSSPLVTDSSGVRGENGLGSLLHAELLTFMFNPSRLLCALSSQMSLKRR